MMKARILAGGLFLAALAPSMYAQQARPNVGAIHCEGMQAHSHEGADRIFRFSVSEKCEVRASSVNSTVIRDAVYRTLQSSGQITNEKSQTRNGMYGAQMNFKDRPTNTGHGQISVLFDAFLGADDISVLYSAVSRKINATDYAANTKHVEIKVDYEITGDTVELTVQKIVDVKKPHLAFGFEDAALEGIRGEFSSLLTLHKNILKSL